ncbi:PREDICTED: probable serine/threonine-protein kinase cdc7, partial [Rhagoletis zephyria]|uniref:probable serine/threonine-protein kinase cdc7 n=1 Tax=Rhagoletis zephyria TaxID=28612 RepID=UPI00081149D6
DPYAAYDTDGPLDDYEYPGAPTALQKQQYQQQLQQRQLLQQQKQQQQEKQPQSRPQQTTTQQQQQAVQGADTQNRPSVDTSTAPTENTLLSTLKSLKIMWDIYQAFAAAWNVLATHRQKQEQQQQEAAKRRQQQIAAQQMRINSKKPPKFEAKDKFAQRNSSSNSNSNKNADNGGGALVKGAGAATTAAKLVRPNNKATKNPKTTTTTKSTTTTELAVVMSSEVEEPVASSSSSSSSSSGGAGKKKVGTKGDAVARQNAQGKREKRQMSEASDATKSTDVGEGRYIKGDPLKGYYDFVITEGSYKFWAVFQTGTALLIIYSTFAAIYYSKVNPLVSDYDYTDYLGGARSLSGGDDDFIDDDSASNSNGMRRGGWFDGMLPRAGRTLKYIFDALDKLPVDHREEDEVMKSEHLTTAVSAQPEQQPWALKVGGVANESDDTTVTVEADANEEENEGRKRN